MDISFQNGGGGTFPVCQINVRWDSAGKPGNFQILAEFSWGGGLVWALLLLPPSWVFKIWANSAFPADQMLGEILPA